MNVSMPHSIALTAEHSSAHAAGLPMLDTLAVGLAAIGVLAALRILWKRPQRWPLRLALQSAALALFYFVLNLPSQPLPEAGTLSILGAGWHAAAQEGGALGAREANPEPPHDLGPMSSALALPEAEEPLPAGVRRVPDLATALRTRPEYSALRMFGHGLEMRDLDAARGRLQAFVAPPLPRGFARVDSPADVMLGAQIEVDVQWSGVAPARLQLLDSAGEMLAERILAPEAASPPNTDTTGTVGPDHAPATPAPADTAPAPSGPASMAPDARPHVDGGTVAHLYTLARAPGMRTLRLRATDEQGHVLAEHGLHVEVTTPPALKTLLLAAAPGPETRALRRWAVDTGLDFDSRIQFAPGLVQGGGVLMPSIEELAALDLLIVEERAWSALGTGGRTRVLAAVEDGLGLLLRLTALPNATVMAELREAGFDVEHRPGESSAQAVLSKAPTRLRRLPIQVESRRSATALHDATGEPLSVWRARGLGRFGLLWLTDTYRLQAAGHAEPYSALWSGLTTVLARAPQAASRQPWLRLPRGQAQAWVGERIDVCDLREPALLQVPGDKRIPLATPDTEGCSAALPLQPGHHVVRDSGSMVLRFDALDPAAHPALRAADLRTRSQALMSTPRNETSEGPGGAPGAMLAWLLALLAVMSALWWLERPRA